MFKARNITPPLYIALGATLWATDSIFRSEVVTLHKPIFIVFYTHMICLLIMLPICLYHFQELKKLTLKHWLALIFLSTGGSIIAMIFFTEAFATTTNYSIPILVQKTQPIFAVIFAAFVLKEKLTIKFIIFASVGMLGSFLVSFKNFQVIPFITYQDLRPSLLALGSAIIWGGCTVAGKVLASDFKPILVTALRYTLAAFILCFLILFQSEKSQSFQHFRSQISTFIIMAYVPGLLALFLYYKGLSHTKATVATFCELIFPVAAVIINWIYLDSPLHKNQIIGAILLLFSVTSLSLSTNIGRKNEAKT